MTLLSHLADIQMLSRVQIQSAAWQVHLPLRPSLSELIPDKIYSRGRIYSSLDSSLGSRGLSGLVTLSCKSAGFLESVASWILSLCIPSTSIKAEKGCQCVVQERMECEKEGKGRTEVSFLEGSEPA